MNCSVLTIEAAYDLGERVLTPWAYESFFSKLSGAIANY